MSDDKILDQAEIDALVHGVDSGAVNTQAEPSNNEVRPYDFNNQMRIVRGRMPTLEMINERFARIFRASLYNLLRRSPEIAVQAIQVKKFSEYVHTLLVPDVSRLNPMNGLGRMFSTRSLVDLAKAFAKFILLALVAVLVLRQKSGELMGLGMEPTRNAIAHAMSLTGHAFLMLAGTLGLIAAIDIPWQLFQHSRQLRMTRQEVREEMKESEGSPEIKGRIRSMQREIASRRMMQEVPKADVVITNPTHFAVALRYDDQRMRAPVVVAKGADLVAAKIREVATDSLVPIFEAPPLARALFKSVELGGEIPASLYVAVAQVLTYIYQLKTARRDGLNPPAPPEIDPTIDETRH